MPMFDYPQHTNIKDCILADIGPGGNLTQNTNTVNINIEGILEKLKKQLGSPDPSTNHNNARRKHHENTSQWLLEDVRYVEWKKQPNSLLWINGISGCGKSLICSTIIEDIKKMVEAQPRIGLGFFYFDINDKAKQNCRSLLSCLVIAFTANSNSYSLTQKFYEKNTKIGSPTDDELLELLMELVKGFEAVYIIIDALDELESDEYDHLFGKVISRICQRKISHLHLLVSSRREQYIIRTMEGCTTGEIEISAELIGKDIISYVQSSVEDYHLRRWGHEIQEYIKHKLITGSNGMFRWVACQVEELKKCPNKKKLMQTLDCLPKNLEATYDQILQRIDESVMSYAKLLLCWLVFGMRPLRLEELATISTFDASNGIYDPDLALASHNDVIQVCSSLVTKANDETVQLAHASVKEYFLAKPRIWQGDKTVLDIESSHAMITLCCLKYLLQDELHTQRSSYFPLFQYSAEYWPDHYKLSNKNSIIHNHAVAFFNNAEAFEVWRTENSDAESLMHEYKECLPIYCAAAFELLKVVQDLMSDDASLSDDKIMVHIAAVRGFTDMVECLLQRMDTDLNTKHGDYTGKALVFASSQGYIQIVKLLLDKGADVNGQCGHYGNPLQAALHTGQTEIVKLLLHKGANPNVQHGYYGNPLQVASFRGQTEIVKLLLDKGADVNAQGGHYGNPLQVALYTDQTEIVKLLLDKGADVNAQGGHYGNPLQAAIYTAQTEIVKLLLDKGADVNGHCGRYGNPLQAASFRGQKEIVKLLLDKGADVNAQGGDYGNPLQAAIYTAQTEIVKLLLDKGADVNGNASQAASSRGQTEIVKLLLDKGADVTCQCGDYPNLLQAASSEVVAFQRN